ncbi:MAG: radical SAM protein [Candidatus Zapsychrus exili]|nr:radical SAM protein [Candidatus Zapsychrus exili]
MNILYVVKTFSVVEPMGILQLSAITKSLGAKSFVASIDQDNIIKKIKVLEINLVALSIMSTESKAFRELSENIRKELPHIKIIVGGPHPTYFPQIVDTWPIDAVVVGEGDLPIVDIINALTEGESLSDIPNVHTESKKNAVRNFIEDLDELPFSDRNLLKDVYPFKHVRMKTFFATRGCPYVCGYCFNSAYNDLYRDKGRILRRRSPESLIREIEKVKAESEIDFIRFGDDVFIAKDDQWLDEFVDKYSKRITIPFYFLINPNFVTEALVNKLKIAGCHSVMMGIEAGNEALRKDVLKRSVSNKAMINAFRIFNDFGIKVFSNTMLGLPGTTLKDDLESLNFTLDCRPYYSGFSVFTPFPGTELYRLCKEKGYLDNQDFLEDEMPTSMQQSSCLNHVTEKQKQIHRNILLLAPVANCAPILRGFIVRHFIYWRTNIIFDFIGFLVRNYQNMRVWPFKKSIKSFFALAAQVFRIDKKNYC